MSFEAKSFDPHSPSVSKQKLERVHSLLSSARGSSSKGLHTRAIQNELDNYILCTQGPEPKSPGLQVYEDETGQIAALSHGVYLESAQVLKLDALAVNESSRGRGIGRKIVQSLVNNSPEYAQKIELHVRRTNVGAVALYRSEGFEVTPVDDSVQTTPYYHMTRTLSA